MSAPDVLRFGVIGAARGEVLLAAIQARPDARVAVVCDIDERRARAVAGRHGVEDVCTSEAELWTRGLDAVVIATPPHLHCRQSVTALEAGCHVLCEVPAVATLEEAAQLVAAVRASGRCYMMAENCNFQPLIDAWRDEAAQGRLGDLVYAETEYIADVAGWSRGAGRATWRDTFAPIQYCTHSLGPILSLTGQRCKTAWGFGTGARVRPEYKADDMELGVFETESGALIKLLIGFSVRRAQSFHYYSVYGTDGVLESTREPEQLKVDVERRRAAEPAMLDAFIGALRGERTNPIDVYTALDYTLPGIIAHQSRQGPGTPLAVPDPRTEWARR